MLQRAADDVRAHLDRGAAQGRKALAVRFAIATLVPDSIGRQRRCLGQVSALHEHPGTAVPDRTDVGQRGDDASVGHLLARDIEARIPAQQGFEPVPQVVRGASGRRRQEDLIGAIVGTSAHGCSP